MQLVCISRGSYGCGKAFAERLAHHLGCRCIGREELLEQATLSGIAAGKLELACVRGALNERMLLEREHYQAFVISYLAEAALAGPLVYHGLCGQWLFKGISHVLRVRVEADLETRIQSVQEKLGLDRDKAEQYIEEVDQDRQTWARTFYDANWLQPRGYDFCLSLERTNADHLAAAFCSIVKLPEFQETPESRQGLRDLLLANQCRLALARDARTRNASFQVQADDGIVSVSYRQREAAEAITPILTSIPGVRQVVCTSAATRILWIQEHFDPSDETFQYVVDLANQWKAAVELLRFRASEESSFVMQTTLGKAAALDDAPGGIQEDLPAERSPSQLDKGGMEETFRELVRLGKAGGRTLFQGTAKNLLTVVQGTANYSLVVIGPVFLDQSNAARARLSQQLSASLREHLGLPVLQAGEIKERFSSRKLSATLRRFLLRCLAVPWFVHLRRRLSIF
ncbi:MAG TPA: cytidylate kinase-like family protein [Terriglobales bacterium]|nr:cytidylate kinase-like family protein [Terriglobales bacterium]